MNFDWIMPDWPAPANVRALCTTRQGGVSQPPYDSLNLGDHVGDDPHAVSNNRLLVEDIFGFPAEPLWLQQVHGTQVCDIAVTSGYPQAPQADASIALQKSQVCVVMTADCLPVLFCDKAGTRVAAAHAGWRGLQAGIVEKTVAALQTETTNLLAWLGPAIGPEAFEVGDEVRSAFVQQDPAAASAFQPSPNAGKWLANIYLLASQRLKALGVTAIYGGDFCTYTDAQRFFSYRRDGQTGRMGSFIWMES